MGYGQKPLLFGIAAVVLAGCVTASKTGQENIAANESPLLFAHPDGVSMQERHFRRYDSANTGARIFRGTWRPSSGGQRPFLFANYHSLGPGYGWTSTPNDLVSEYVSSLNFGNSGKPTLGALETTRNKLGVVTVQHFTISSDACFGFVQYFGNATFGTVQGTERLHGFYCGTESSQLPNAKVRSIMNSVGVKGHHVPPAVAAAVERQRASSPNSNFIVSINWADRFDNLSGRMSATNIQGSSGRIAVSLPNRAGTCSGTWKYKSGKYGTAETPNGTWDLLCTNGLKASGNYNSPTQGHGSGTGKDVEGKAVTFQFRPA